MDIKRYINTRIWYDTWFEELDSIEKLVWLYLLTNQQTNLIGIYEIGLKRISNESGVELNRLVTVMERFANEGKAFHNGKYLVVPNYLKNQKLANPNMEKYAGNLFSSLPEEVKNLLKSIGINHFQDLKNGLPNRYQTVTKPFGNRKEEIGKGKREILKGEREGECKGDESPPGDSADLEDVFFDEEKNTFEEAESEQPTEQEGDISATNVSGDDVEKTKKLTQLEMLDFVVLPHDTPKFREAWERWLKYKTIIKDTYKAPETMQAALKKFANYPPEVGIRAIEDSISNQWKGVFPEKKAYHERNQQNNPQPASSPGGLTRVYEKLTSGRRAGGSG